MYNTIGKKIHKEFNAKDYNNNVDKHKNQDTEFSKAVIEIDQTLKEYIQKRRKENVWLFITILAK